MIFDVSSYDICFANHWQSTHADSGAQDEWCLYAARSLFVRDAFKTCSIAAQHTFVGKLQEALVEPVIGAE